MRGRNKQKGAGRERMAGQGRDQGQAAFPWGCTGEGRRGVRLAERGGGRKVSLLLAGTKGFSGFWFKKLWS